MRTIDYNFAPVESSLPEGTIASMRETRHQHRFTIDLTVRDTSYLRALTLVKRALNRRGWSATIHHHQ